MLFPSAVGPISLQRLDAGAVTVLENATAADFGSILGLAWQQGDAQSTVLLVSSRSSRFRSPW